VEGTNTVARDTLKWQHLDMDGKKIENGKRYILAYPWTDGEATVWWNQAHGYICRRDGDNAQFTLPFDYRGNRVCVYKVRRVE
jgi:hypothetical protein